MDTEPQWYAFYVQARHEKKVEQRLIQKNIVTFLPLIKVRKKWSDRYKMVKEPLIRGYVFCKIRLQNRLDVLETPGTINIVRIGEKYPPIQDNEIRSLEILVNGPNPITQEHAFMTGEQVTIQRGPFKGAHGVVIREKNRSRLTVGLEAINASFSVEIDSIDLAPVN